MFYSYTLLHKGGAFALIWELATLSEKKLKASSLTQKQKKELNSVDISRKCEELMRYIPTGVLSRKEVDTKMSLYLLAVLQYGIVVAYHRKVDICLLNLKAVHQLLQPSLIKERAPTTTRTTTTRRKRRHAPDEGENIEVGAMLPEEAELLGPLPDTTVRDLDPNESSQNLRRITLDEFEPARASPSSFLRPSLDADQFNVEELIDMDMLRFSPASREAEIDVMDRAFSRQLDVDDEIRQMMAEFIEPHSDPFPMVELDRRSIEASSAPFLEYMADQFPAADAESSRAPLNAVENMEDSMIMPPMEGPLDAENIDKENISPLRLATLTDSQLLEDVRDARRARPRPRRNLMIDDKTSLDDDEMRLHMESYSDICTMHERFDENVSRLRPTAEELLRPYPSYLPFNEEWAEMFTQAAFDALERREESRQEEEEPMPAADVAHQQEPGAHVEQPEIPPIPEPQQLFAELEIPLETHPEAVGAFGQPLPADVEADGFIVPPPPMQFEPEFEQYPEDAPGAQPAFDQSSMFAEMARDAQGLSPRRFSSLTGGKSPLPMIDEFPSTITTPSRDTSNRQSPILQAEDLMDRLTELNETTVEFNEMMHKTSKKRAARDFFNLLALLKEARITVEQREPFAPIMVTLL